MDWSAFKRNEDGVVAIEFAFLAIPFFLTLLAIMEIALVLTAAMQFEHAVNRVSRRIMTGETQHEQAAIRKDLCGEIVLNIDCASMRIDYKEIANVSQFNLPSPLKNKRVNEEAFTFKILDERSFASLRVGYEWPLVIGPIATFLSNLDNGKLLLVSTDLIRIEK